MLSMVKAFRLALRYLTRLANPRRRAGTYDPYMAQALNWQVEQSAQQTPARWW